MRLGCCQDYMNENIITTPYAVTINMTELSLCTGGLTSTTLPVYDYAEDICLIVGAHAMNKSFLVFDCLEEQGAQAGVYIAADVESLPEDEVRYRGTTSYLETTLLHRIVAQAQFNKR